MRAANTGTGFAQTVAAWTKAARRGAAEAAGNIAARLGETVINATPVRTGKARAAWTPSIGAPAVTPASGPAPGAASEQDAAPARPSNQDAASARAGNQDAASARAGNQDAAPARPSNQDAVAAQAAGESLDRLKTLSWNPETGESFFLLNSVPYIGFLEYGGSASAPAGMVRLAAASFKGAAAEEAARVRRGAASGRGSGA